MDMSKMVGLIVAVTVSIIVFVSVLVPIIANATGSNGQLNGDYATWGTLVTVCGTLTVIVILMMVVRNLGNKE